MKSNHLSTVADQAAAPVHPAREIIAARESKQRHPGLINSLLVLLIVSNLVCLFYYLAVTYQFQFHSDSAAANLLAQEIYETGQYFPRDWNYVNGDLWVMFMQTWILVLLPFFPNGYALHAAGTIFGLILTGLATWGGCGVLQMSLRARLLVLALLSAGFTPVMSEHLYGQQAYGTFYYVACAILVCGWKFIHAQGWRRMAWGLGGAALIMLAAWANPQRGLVYNVLPLLAGVVMLYRTANLKGASAALSLRTGAQLGAASIVALVGGALLYRSTLAENININVAMAVTWTDFSSMVNNVLRGLQGFIGVLAGLPKPGLPIATPAGVLDALRLVAGIAVIVLVPYALNKLIRSRHPGRAFFAAAAATSLAASLFVYLTTSMAGGPPETSVRYLVPGIVLVMIAFVAFIVDHATSVSVKRVSGVIALVVLALSAPLSFEVIDYKNHFAGGGIEQANHKLRLARFLEAQGLKHGYATFWNAGVTTVLSSSAVKVHQINLTSKIPEPMRHLSSNRWYEADYWKGPSFLLLTKDELGVISLPSLFEVSGQPRRTIEFEGYQIVVFDHNIAADFPSWKIRVTAPLQYRTTAATHHTTGRYVPEERAITAEKGETGVLRFGPYQPLAGGRYLVSFDIRTEGGDEKNQGFVDVVANGGKDTLGTRVINRSGTQRITLEVASKTFMKDVEFRVFTTGVGKMSVFNVELANDNRH